MKLQPAQVSPWLQINWDWRATGNFVGGGIGAGLVIAAAAGALAGAPNPLLVIAGLLAVAAGLASVSLEIGRPLRALNVVRHPARSWMSREALVAPVLFGAGALAAWRGGAWLGIAAAVALAYLYCQARILQSSKGVPAWREPRVVPLLLVSGLVEGGGAAVALAVIFPPSVPGVAALAVLAALLILRAAAWRRYREALGRSGSPSATALVLARFERPWLLLGHGLPLALLAGAALGEGAAGAAWAGSAGAVIGALAGVWLKGTLVTRAGHVQGFALARTPVRGWGVGGPAVRPGWASVVPPAPNRD